MTDTPESLRAMVRLLHGYTGHWDLNPAISALTRYAEHLEKCAGVWVDVRKQMPSDYRGMVIGLESAGFARDMEWCDGRFKYWDDGTEAYPTHWLAMRTPGEGK